MPLYEFEGKQPRIHPSSWIAPSADIVGDVTVWEQCYIGWGAVLRADHGSIEIGEGTAVEEGVIIHTPKGFASHFGIQATLGHGSIYHGATIEDFAVVGIRAIVSNYGVVGQWSIIGEAGLVKENQHVPSRVIAVGQPVKIIGEVTEKHQQRWVRAKQAYMNFVVRNKKFICLLS